MERIETDVCVIGAGSGGLSVAAGAVQLGARVVLIEGGRMGGDCLNYGCVPSKALLASSKAAAAMRHAGVYGVGGAEPEVDYARVMERVQAVIAAVAPADSQERFEGLGVRVVRDWGRFVSPEEVEAGGLRIKARRFVVATGSGPLVPPIPGLDTVPFLTNETLFDLRERPEHLLVIGGGPIGMEMAQAHVRLGSRVTIIEGAKALGKEDPEAAAVVLNRLRAEGVEIVESTKVAEVSSEGGVTVRAEGGASWTGSHLLLAVGRQVALDRLDLDRAGVDHDRKGVTVGDDLRSKSNRRVYAVGDAAGRLMFTHVAGYHAGIVVRRILFGLPAKARQSHIPWATYTDPELAQVGMTEAEARQAHGSRLTVARFRYGESDRAQTEGRTEGFIKVMVVRGRPVGATIVGAGAGELIGLWALALSSGLKMSAVASMVAPYPTLTEIDKRAASAYLSPKLFGNPMVKRVVRLVQRALP